MWGGNTECSNNQHSSILLMSLSLQNNWIDEQQQKQKKGSQMKEPSHAHNRKFIMMMVLVNDNLLVNRRNWWPISYLCFFCPLWACPPYIVWCTLLGNSITNNMPACHYCLSVCLSVSFLIEFVVIIDYCLSSHFSSMYGVKGHVKTLIWKKLIWIDFLVHMCTLSLSLSHLFYISGLVLSNGCFKSLKDWGQNWCKNTKPLPYYPWRECSEVTFYWGGVNNAIK